MAPKSQKGKDYVNKIFPHDNGSLEYYYHAAERMLYGDLINSPTSLIDIPASPRELAEMSSNNAEVQAIVDKYLAEHGNQPPPGGWGKVVI
ncbi:MAG: hypothetical protein A2Z49_09650 [Chloroflexi bacterium RBG_19FT_COMBO_56_12]|nr:MAG: hypothetical protein A2Z49_09650 [Chloroflexi bacterium RBG_19FT_COMBO_56_12]